MRLQDSRNSIDLVKPSKTKCKCVYHIYIYTHTKQHICISIMNILFSHVLTSPATDFSSVGQARSVRTHSHSFRLKCLPTVQCPQPVASNRICATRRAPLTQTSEAIKTCALPCYLPSGPISCMFGTYMENTPNTTLNVALLLGLRTSSNTKCRFRRRRSTL